MSKLERLAEEYAMKATSNIVDPGDRHMWFVYLMEAYLAGERAMKEMAAEVVGQVDVHLDDLEQRAWIKSAIRALGES